MELSENQKVLASGRLPFGVEKETVPFLVAWLKKPQHTEGMINYLLDNPRETRSDILQKVVELTNE